MAQQKDSTGARVISARVSDLRSGAQDKGKHRADVLVVEASIKPFINLVWNGIIILIVGFIITIVRRARQARFG